MYLWCSLDEGQAEESIASVLEQLLKGNDQTPWMRAVDNEPLKENTDDLLAHVRVLLLRVVDAEEPQDGEAEVVCVRVGIPQLVRHRTQEIVPAFWSKRLSQSLEQRRVRR